MTGAPKPGERKPVPASRQLRELQGCVRGAIRTLATASEYLDATMKMPDSEARGKRIATVANAIDMAKDSLWHFGLGHKLPVKLEP
jgi:hypothetical protein